MTVGNKIRLARKRAEYPIPTAAKALGIPVGRLQLYEHDDIALPPTLAVKMAKLYGISVDEICDDNGTFINIPVFLDRGAVAPQKKAGGGFDIIASRSVFIPSGRAVVVDTGIHIEVPAGYSAAVVSCPALSHRFAVTAEGMADSGSRDSLKVYLSNQSDTGYFCQAGSKIAEMLILPCQLVNFEGLSS